MTERHWSYSTDEESYYGSFQTPDEAIAEAATIQAEFWVGENIRPRQPESYWDVDDWIEQVSCSDEYSSDFAEDWFEGSVAQCLELKTEVQHVLSRWLDRHSLRPRFWVVENPVRFTTESGAVVPVGLDGLPVPLPELHEKLGVKSVELPKGTA